MSETVVTTIFDETPAGKAYERRETCYDLKRDSLRAHNRYRKDHGSPPMVWNDDLAKNAQEWAEEIAVKGLLVHHTQREEGENIAAAGQKAGFFTGRKAAELWYSENEFYDYNDPGLNIKAGHFTQLIWAESLQLGVGKALSPTNGMQFIVARYFPAGNERLDFPDNIKPKGTPPPEPVNQSEE